MVPRITITKLCLGGGLFLALCAATRAGDLNPPVGPVGPTLKPLAEVEPRTAVNNLPGQGTSKHHITQPGSYYLIADVVSTQAGEIGILVDSNEVSIDLLGFTLRGAGGNGGAGIEIDPGYKNISIRNGRIRGWGVRGIETGQATHVVVQNVQVSENGSIGIHLGGSSMVTGCLVWQNTGEAGIRVSGNKSYVDGNVCLDNGRGIYVTGISNLIVRNVAENNSTADFDIASGNNYGQILTNPGANFTSSIAWANFAGCPTGQTSCGGVCVNTQIDPNNCGLCGNICTPPPNMSASCVNGVCQYLCNPGYVDCNNNQADGCEVFVQTDVNNCGNCGLICAFRPNTIRTCVNGVCTYSCNPGFGDCNGNPNDGCETSLNSTSNCGGCGLVCPGAPNASPVCTGGICGINCVGSFRNCDGNNANGCEINITTDSQNCGACGNVCSLPNAMATCSGGICQVGACIGGYTNCNGINADGCECPPTSTCSAGVCTP